MGIILPQTVLIKPNKLTKYYQEKGYITNGPNTLIEIKVEDLYKGSSAKIKCKCDFCGNEYLKDRRTIKDINEKFACKHCSIYKGKDTLIKKYGVDSIFKSKEFRNKIKQTWIDNYGVDNPNKSQEIINKRNKTNLEKYGNKCSMNGTNKYKSKETFLKKYGVDHNSKTDLYKEKFRKICIKRYGVSNPMQCPKIKEKSMLNRKTHNNNCSKQQRYINILLNGEINKYINGYYADIFLKDKNIIIEYDGSGHWFGVKHYKISLEEFQEKELIRENSLLNSGYKLIRIISKKDLIPIDKEILYLINKSETILNNASIIKIDIDNNQFIVDDKIIEKIEFKKLRYIKGDEFNCLN